jgi:hypothetical protein
MCANSKASPDTLNWKTDDNRATNNPEWDRGAAHLKKWDTPPPNFGAVAFTFVNAALTLLTPVFIVLLAFALTLLTALLTFVSTAIH